MGRRKKLDLLNYRLAPVTPAQVVDSLDHRRYEPVYLNDGGARIPFMSKPEAAESDYAAWRRGRIKGGGTGDQPLIDERGHYYEVAKRCELGPATVRFSTRVYNEFDYMENDTARIYYCQKKRIDTPAMNRVMDNTHEVVMTETISGRVDKGMIAGGSWTTTQRLSSTPVSPVGPGHYNVFAFEAKYGPGSSNLLQFLSAASGRDVDESNRRPTKADRIKSRKFLATAGGIGSRSPTPSPERNGRALTCSSNSFDSLAARSAPLTTHPETSTAGQDRGFGAGDRWRSPLYRREPYVKTSGAKLAPDFDVALRERERVPPKFPTMPQRYEPKVDKAVDVEIEVDWGPKASIATAARDSPVKYSMAFRSKAPVGMFIAPPTSPPHLGPGWTVPPPGLVIKNPHTPSIPFMPQHKGTSLLKEPEEVPGTLEQVRPFSETNRSGPKFSLAGTGAGLVMKHKVERQVKTIYPRLGKRMFPVPKVEHVDPWKHLRPKKK